MTSNFSAKRSGSERPQLSLEEYKEKKKAEKEAVYKMLDETALAVVQSPGPKSIKWTSKFVKIKFRLIGGQPIIVRMRSYRIVKTVNVLKKSEV